MGNNSDSLPLKTECSYYCVQLHHFVMYETEQLASNSQKSLKKTKHPVPARALVPKQSAVIPTFETGGLLLAFH